MATVILFIAHILGTRNGHRSRKGDLATRTSRNVESLRRGKSGQDGSGNGGSELHDE